MAASAFETDLAGAARGVALAVHGRSGWTYQPPSGDAVSLASGLIVKDEGSERDDDEQGHHVLRRAVVVGSAADVALPAERGSVSDGTNSYEIIPPVRPLPGGMWEATIVRSDLVQKTYRQSRS